MTVAELIKQLQKMPQDATIMVWQEGDNEYCTEGKWVNAVSVELWHDGVRIADW